MTRSQDTDVKKNWEHVHLCVKCGHTLHPDEIELGSIMLGVSSFP
jgi:hypothetical protein